MAGNQSYILIVDDEPELRETLASFLTDQSYSIETAATGEEALACIERQRPTLIVLDIHLPGMDGRAFTAELRARGSDVPIVVITGAAEARQAAEEIGAAAYVAKPIALPLLLSRIESAIA